MTKKNRPLLRVSECFDFDGGVLSGGYSYIHMYILPKLGYRFAILEMHVVGAFQAKG